MAKIRQNWALIAETILREAVEPLSAEKIAEQAFKIGLRVPGGPLPGESIKSAIRADIADRGHRSPFVIVKGTSRQNLFWVTEFERLMP